jgi:putative oxidoreductase
MSSSLARFAPLPLRLMLATSFLYHGLPKFTADGNRMFVGMLEMIGAPLPGLTSYVVALVEVTGGLALLAGVLVPVAAGLLAVVMLVAMVTVHLPNGFGWMNMTGMTEAGPVFGLPGAELSLLFIAMLVSLILSGPGEPAVRAGQRD